MLFNFKASGSAAISAFCASVLIGLISGGGILVVLLRAGILGAGFFVLITCAQILLRQFLPELLFRGTMSAPEMPEPPGSRLDISVDDNSEDASLAALLASAGVDTGKSDNADSKTTDKPAPNQGKPLSHHANLESLELSDDLPSFAALDDEEEEITKESEALALNKKYGDGNPGQNYSPKDLASAITTMLKQ